MGFSLDRGIGTAFVDEVAGDDGVVVVDEAGVVDVCVL